jgi:hypothetical protein
MVVWVIKPLASYILGKYFTIELPPSPADIFCGIVRLRLKFYGNTDELEQPKPLNWKDFTSYFCGTCTCWAGALPLEPLSP